MTLPGVTTNAADLSTSRAACCRRTASARVRAAPACTRYDVGAEWFDRRPTGYAGTPFAAANLEWRGDMGNTPNWTLQAGWMWRNPFQREAVFRLFAEYYSGKSPYGHLFRDKERFYSVGIAFDY